MKRWIFRNAIRFQLMVMTKKRGSLEEMFGRSWMFWAVIVIVMLFGPEVVSLVKNALGTGINSVSSTFTFTP